MPSITSVVSDAGYTDLEKKAAVLLSRFLMKLNCSSEFSEHPSCLLNEILRECEPIFDDFCHGVIAIGKEHSHTALADLLVLKKGREDEDPHMELYDFISKSNLHFLRSFEAMYDKDTENAKVFRGYSAYDFDGEEKLTHEQFETLLSRLREMLTSLDSYSFLSPHLLEEESQMKRDFLFAQEDKFTQAGKKEPSIFAMKFHSASRKEEADVHLVTRSQNADKMKSETLVTSRRKSFVDPEVDSLNIFSLDLSTYQIGFAQKTVDVSADVLGGLGADAEVDDSAFYSPEFSLSPDMVFTPQGSSHISGKGQSEVIMKKVDANDKSNAHLRIKEVPHGRDMNTIGGFGGMFDD